MIAERLNQFLKGFLQDLEVFFSDEAIDRGARWFDTIGVQLEQSEFGIICLTKENRRSPWMLFEVGALAKNLKTAHVCPVLFGLDMIDIEGPLAQFQLTRFGVAADIYKLCWTINGRLRKSLDHRTFDRLFDVFWPKTEAEIRIIVDGDPSEPSDSSRSMQDMIAEVWQMLRRTHYTDTVALNQKFTVQLVDSMSAHFDWLAEKGLISEAVGIDGLLRPIDHFISQVVDKPVRTTLVNKYIGFRSKVR